MVPLPSAPRATAGAIPPASRRKINRRAHGADTADQAADRGADAAADRALVVAAQSTP